ncbi:WXG100 family type VII secretion target [Nocardia terpenica]|uniref:WXG100 family type VII secretion target n=1 Tax=Nocardia terpenica TaxID=455432 RepID=A0A164I869_9NOCA|nr:hypothetical protein [Nocardia terpenica]ATL65756.1 hypothetical protein CRH09_05535 [Nocardia terpenica]KZM69186.1 hypothetical protein AWN90_15840 [Nocardia terpenica]MBF6061703.1 hypothetical protein [Nocardia terpenica]MBF6107502.1 hypothetical protein [Nocardia terpenica]MBF6110123.1 hypothetical protein [Nocardia terpenica]
MKYDAPTLTHLSEELGRLYGQLQTQASQLQAAAKTLETAWEGNQGFEGFHAAKNKWDNQFGREGDTGPDTALGKVNALSKAVSDALSSAQHTDGKVGSGFGG